MIGNGHVEPSVPHAPSGASSGHWESILLLGLLAVLVTSEIACGELDLDPFRTIGMGSGPQPRASPTEPTFLTGSTNGLQIWSITGEMLSAPIAGTSVHAEWSSDGERILATLGNGSYTILTKQGKTILSVGPESGIPQGYAHWSGEQAVVEARHYPAGTDRSKALQVWDLESARLVKELELEEYVMQSSWSHRGGHLAVSLNNDNNLYIYDTRTWTVGHRIRVGDWPHLPTWSTDDGKLAWATMFPGTTETISIWSAETQKIMAKTKIPRPGVFAMAWSRDGSFLSVACEWGLRIRVFNGTNLEELYSFPLPEQVIQGASGVTWSHDGSYLITPSEAKIRIWDSALKIPDTTQLAALGGVRAASHLPSGTVALGTSGGVVVALGGDNRLLWTSTPEQSGVTDLEWAPTPRGPGSIVVGYESGNVYLLGNQGTIQHSWGAHTGAIVDLEWSPHGGGIATAGADGYLATWTPSGHLGQRTDAGSPTSLAWSPDATKIVTGSPENPTNLWDSTTLTPVQAPKRVGAFTSMDWVTPAHDPNLSLIVGAAGERCLVWDAFGRNPFYKQLEAGSEITSISWSPNGSMLAACTQDGSVKVWDMVEKRDPYYGDRRIGGLLETFESPNSLVSVDWVHDSSHVVAISVDASLHTWSMSNRYALQLSEHSYPVSALSWSPGSDSVVFPVGRKELCIYDLSTDTTHCMELRAGGLSRISCLEWSPDGTRIAAGGHGNHVEVLRPNGESLYTAEHQNTVTDMDWSPDAHYLATSSIDRTIRVWDGQTGSLMVSLSGHGNTVWSVSWTPDGRGLISTDQDGEVKFWDIATGQDFRTIVPVSGNAYDAMWSRDMSSILVSSYDSTQGQGRLLLMDPHGGRIWEMALRYSSHHIAWSPDGSQIAYGQPSTTGGQITIATATGYPLCNLTGHGGGEVFQWAPNGAYIATGGSNGLLRLYDAGPISLIPEMVHLSLTLLVPCFVIWARSCNLPASRAPGWSASCLLDLPINGHGRRCLESSLHPSKERPRP